MIVRENLIKQISQKLAHLANVTKIQNKQGLFDINKSTEDLFAGLLNLSFDMNFVNENKAISNYPAIDLSDAAKRICVQVTSETSNQKIRETISKFNSNQLNNRFDNLLFLIISVENKPTCDVPDFVNIINISDLAKKIEAQCSDEKLHGILSFLESKLNISTHSQTILPSGIVPTFKNPSNPDILIKFLRYSESEQEYINQLIKDLNSLANALKDLTRNQRELLYYIINSGVIYRKWYDSIGITSADLNQRFGDEGYQIFSVLESKNLLYLDDEFEINDRLMVMVFAKFQGVSDDLNLFIEFKRYFERNLYNLIVDVNFSCLSSNN